MQSLWSYLDQGGVIVYILIGLNILGFTVMIYKFVEIVLLRSKKERVVDEVVSQLDRSKEEFLLERSKDIIADKMIQLERGLGIIKSIASIAPLLGLLGTVIGVLISFKEISKSGLDDPSVFASGISMALITTVVGLVVAIPHYLGYNFLIGILDRLEASLNKEVGDRL